MPHMGYICDSIAQGLKKKKKQNTPPPLKQMWHEGKHFS